MASSEKEVYAFCKQCKENIRLSITQEDLDQAKSGLIAVLSVHGSPQHALLAYLDRNLRVRGIEYPAAVQVKDTPEVSVVEESEVDIADEVAPELTLRSLVDFFGRKEKEAISILARLIAHIMTKKPVVLIHDDRSLGTIVKSHLTSLLTQQTELIEVIDHDSLQTIAAEQPFIFDLQMSRIVREGVKTDFKYFEQIIRDALSSENSFFQLKYELSKLFFSYRRLVDLLRSSEGKLLDRKLARDIAIDFSFLSTLLDIAASEGIDTKGRVERDGLGSAIRSI
ncbi:hypothetical protein EU545_03765 [Candidatus Thorarchaeota archaeon]|nr:MAG: hypothetical protein EU545_03765 [Candidatus Thorarchaeota archaeon]